MKRKQYSEQKKLHISKDAEAGIAVAERKCLYAEKSNMYRSGGRYPDDFQRPGQRDG